MPKPLTELVKLNDQNLADVDGITDILNDAPFINQVFADVASNGTDHKYLKETTAAGAGFRDPYDGVANAHSVDTLVTINLKILDASFDVDSAIASEFKNGFEAFMAREANRHLRSAFSLAEKQLFYGSGNDADGFDGLADAASVEFKDSAMVVDATGASDVSDVWAVRSVGSMTDVMVITGNDGRIDMLPWYYQMKAGSSTGTYNAVVQPIQGWLGLQLGSIWSVGRIANVADADGKRLTDSLISKLLAKAPAGRPFTHLVMSRRSQQMLQDSRTATNPTGSPAPFPTEAFGVPIITTDSIPDDATALAAAV